MNNNPIYPKLNFPSFPFRTRRNNEKYEIFDVVRKKYVALTPEEWVRQHVISYLHLCKEYPIELMQVEGQIMVNNQPKRCDIVIYNKNFEPALLVECKQPLVNINQKTFDQACRYNLILDVPYLFITNGLQHYCFSLVKEEKRFEYHKELPDKHILGFL
jgi:type I site-specific restriction endonuclease